MVRRSERGSHRAAAPTRGAIGAGRGGFPPERRAATAFSCRGPARAGAGRACVPPPENRPRPPSPRLRRGGKGVRQALPGGNAPRARRDRKSTRLNSSHVASSYAVFCLKKKKQGE